MNEDPTLASPSSKDKIPWTIVLLIAASVIFTLAQLYKFIQVLINWQILATLGLRIPPVYLALSGLVWGMIGSIAIWSIWSRKSWAPVSFSLFAVLYGILFWIDQVFISQPETFVRRWPLNLSLTILGLGIIILTFTIKSTRTFFGKNTVKIP